VQLFLPAPFALGAPFFVFAFAVFSAIGWFSPLD
jgi:hypothetical protein